MPSLYPTPIEPPTDTVAGYDSLRATATTPCAIDFDRLLSPVKICHVSMTLQTGGLERLLVEFARHTDRHRFDLMFVALGEGGRPAEEIRRLGYPVHCLGFPERGKLGMIRQLKGLLRKGKFDIVHTHNTYPHFYGTIAAKLARVPDVINTQHGRGCGNGWKDRWQFRLANRFARHVVGVSDDAAILCSEQDSWSAAKMLRIWNGIDVDRFNFTGPHPEYSAISVARLSPEKDFATLLRAVALVRREQPQFRLRIVGDGSERAALEQLAYDLGLATAVEFMGERSNVADLLTTAGFFVSSSKTEGISLTVLEAMSVGLPVVTTAVGGNPEIVVNGETGLLAPPQNPSALAKMILRMCRARSKWRSMGRAARDRVEQHFNIRTTLSQYESVYDRLAGHRHRHPR